MNGNAIALTAAAVPTALIAWVLGLLGLTPPAEVVAAVSVLIGYVVARFRDSKA